MKLTDREHEVVTNIYGNDTPRDLRAIETEQLVTIHNQVSQAIENCYAEKDIDRDSLGIFLPLEGKLGQVLYDRL